MSDTDFIRNAIKHCPEGFVDRDNCERVSHETVLELCDKADRLAAIERRIENLINGKKLHADRLREEGKGEHCEGFIDALDDEVDDLIAILCPPEGT